MAQRHPAMRAAKRQAPNIALFGIIGVMSPFLLSDVMRPDQDFLNA
jgi:hypothetical protein